MAIAINEKVPAGELMECTEFSSETHCPVNPEKIDVLSTIADKKIVIFGVPGAFTPLCSEQHLPGYIALADDIKAKGVDEIWCFAVNDPFVMGAWGQSLKATNKVRMMADGSASFTKALKLDRDLSGAGMGTRCHRFAMIVDRGVVSYIGVEGSGEFHASKAETVLAEL